VGQGDLGSVLTEVDLLGRAAVLASLRTAVDSPLAVLGVFPGERKLIARQLLELFI